MTGGEVIADGEAKKILTDTTLTLSASIVPPQITQIFLGLSDFGVPSDVIDVSEAKRILMGYLRGAGY
jgi:hypothetical protein